MRERDIEAYLVERVKAMRGEVRKVKWVGRRGAPDRVVMLPERVIPKWDGEVKVGAICTPTGWTTPARTLWVELKAPNKTAEPHQLREHVRMRKMGQRVEVVDSFNRVDEVLE